MKLFTSIAVVSALALTACTDYQSAGPKQQGGVVTGALIGGALGATSKGGDRVAKTALGAVIGGAIGGAIGANLDRQEAELRRDMGGNAQIRNTGRELIVTLSQDILFATDSTSVRPDLQNELYTLAGSLNDYPDTTVQVVGHTDNVGSAAYNQDLSERRAAAVGAVLRNGGVSSRRIVTIGRGESQPVASNTSAGGRSQNRRVEIIIRPNN